MDGPVFVFFTGVSPSFSNRMRAQLRRGVDVELLARVRVDLGLEPPALVVELLAELVEELEVDADAGVFHAREHAHERALDALVEIDELARSQRLFERVDEREQQRGAALRLLDADVAVEIERALDAVGRRELDREVAAREIFERVLPLARIEEVRHDRGVVLERPQVDVQTRARAPWPGARRALGSARADERLELRRAPSASARSSAST